MRELRPLDAARECPDRPCLVTPDNVLSYRAVADHVRVAMRSLGEQGVQPGDSVAITPNVDAGSAAWLYAAFELGCPVVLLHPRFTERERARILEETSPRLTLASNTLPEPTTDGAPTFDTDHEVPADRALAIVYTSGTGGTPRGAVLSRRAFVASCRAHAENLPWTPDDRWLLAMPPAHVGGLSVLTRCLIARRTAVLADGPFAPSETIGLIRRCDVTILSMVPTMLARLLDHEPRWEPSKSLRAVLVGGAPLTSSLQRRAVERGLPILRTYGSTEACSQVATQRLDQVGTAGSGAPLAGVEVRVRDGEIQLAGETMMDGYIGDALRASRFTTDGWFRTRDGGAFGDDGQLHVTGRLDDVIVSGGENVAPAEVEAVLADVPGVESVCVFGVPDPRWGEEVVVAMVAATGEVDASRLHDALSSHLAGFKRPKRVAWLDSMPLNRNGKVDRSRVAELALDRLEPI